MEGPHAGTALALRQKLAVIEEAMRVPPDERILLRHSARQILLQLASMIEGKLSTAQADFDAEKQKQAEAAADGGAAATPSPKGAATGGGGGAGGKMDEAWLAERFRHETKKILRQHLVPGLFDEMLKGKEAAGDALEAQLRVLDKFIADLSAAGGRGGEGELEQAEWRRFECLREWARLGIKPRPPYII